MARTKLNDGQLEKLVNADKVSGASLNITGSDVTALTTLTANEHFLVQSTGSVPKKISSDAMSAYFSKVDLTEADGENAEMRIVFVDASGTDNEDLFVDTGVLTYNPTGDILTVPHLKSPILRSAAGLDIDAGGSGKLTLDGPGGIDIGVAANVAVDFNSAAFDLDAAGAITIDGTSTLSLDAADDTNLSMAANSSSAKTLTIAASNSGSGAGVLDLDADGAITVDAGAGLSLQGGAASDLTTGAGALTLDGAGGVSIAGNSSEVDITTSGAFDVNVGSVDLDSSAGVAIDGTVLSLDGTDDSNLTVTASGKDLDIAVAGGSTQELRLASAGTGASALHLNASAGGVDIDSADMITLDAADEITLTTTSADGHISLVSAHTSGVAFHIDANANAASEVQIDAGILDVDVTGAATIDAGGAMTLTAAGVALAGGSSEIDITTSGALDLNSGAMTLDASSISLDGSGAVNIDTSDTTNGVKIGAATSAMPVTIGHTTSEVTVGDNLNVGGNAVITGNLTVNGDTTTISTTNLNVEDSLIVLQAENTSGSSTSDLGIIMERGSTGDNAALIWDEGADKFLFGTTTETGADTDVTVSVGTVQVGKLEIDGTGDSIDVDTDLKVIAAADIVLDPGGNNVVPGSDSADSLGKAATSASHSAGSSASGLTSNLNGQTISMDNATNVAVLYGSDNALTAPSGGSAPSGLESAIGSSVSLSSFSSTHNGTLTVSNSYSGSTISAGTILSLNGSSSSFFFVVTADYSGGSSMQICALPNINGHQTSIGSVSSISSYSGSFSGTGLSGVSASAGQTVAYTLSGGSAVFVLVTAITSSTPWGFVADPRDDLSAASSFSGTPSAATAGGSVTAAASQVAWANLYVDAIDLNGQGSLSVGGTGRIDLDADDDTSIRASADDVITFEVGGSDLVDIKAAGLQITDDKKLMFGAASGGDASFEYDEDGNDVLLYAGASLRISDDVKIEFGSGGDAGIEYDEDGTDQLRIHQPAAGVVIAGTNPKLVLGDAGAEDTMLVFDGNAEDFRIGLDDGTDILEIGSGASHGAQIAIKIDGSENVDIASHDASSVGLKLAGTLVTSTAAELNIMDGGTSATSTTVATGDRVVFNDAGTMKQVSVDQLGEYYGGGNGIQATSAGVLSVECVTDIATSATRNASDASHSAGSSASGLTSNLSSGQSFAMNISQNQAVLYGSSLSAGSGASAPSGISTSTLTTSGLSSFSSTPSGTLAFSGNSGASVSAGTVMSLQDSGSNKFFFVVVEDYTGSSGSTTMKVHAMGNISGHTTSVSSFSDIQQHSSISGSGLSGVSASAGQTVKYTFSGGTATFALAAAISSGNAWGFVADPRDDLSTLSTFSSSGTPSSATAGGSITEAVEILSSNLKTGSLTENPCNNASIQVYLNGMLQTPSGSVEGTPDGGSQGAMFDYILNTSGSKPKVLFDEALDGDDVLQIRYIKA